MPRVELARYSDPAQASVAQSALNNAGIESFIFEEHMIYLVTARLMVLDEDEAKARRLLMDSST